MLNELERNLQDAMAVARNILLDPRIIPGGGAVEMSVGKVSASPSLRDRATEYEQVKE